MPFYTYRCNKCQKTIEVSQKITEDHFRIHSEAEIESDCNGSVSRQIHSPLIKFNGSGFYETDYKRKEASDKKNSNEMKPIKTTVTKKDEKV